MKNQREKYKKNKRKAINVIESNLSLKVEDQKVIFPEILAKLQDDQKYLSTYISQRQEFIKMLNDLIGLNHSHTFTKIVKQMLSLANNKQGANCKKMSSLKKSFYVSTIIHSY